MKEKLVITNYDNFKNADFFIDQYYKAKDMLKEVNDFFMSFIGSKLITGKDLNNIHPSALVGDYHHSEWTSKFIGYNYLSSASIPYYYLDKNFNNNCKRCKERIEENKIYTPIVLNQLHRILTNTDFDCYYVLSQDNVLYEFIPIASKNSIEFNFDKKDNNIYITGYFYHYHEGGAQFGASYSSLDKITKTIIIDKSNNNVIKVDCNVQLIQEGNANGKSYWDKNHEDYCLSDMDGINTNDFDNVKMEIYKINSGLHHRNYTLEQLHEKFDERYKKSYKEDLTDTIIKDCIRYNF